MPNKQLKNPSYSKFSLFCYNPASLQHQTSLTRLKMIFSSYIFIFVFLPIVWIIYHVLRHFSAYNASKIFLVLASLFFYAFWKVEYLPILLGSIFINFLISLAISRDGMWCKDSLGFSKLFLQSKKYSSHTRDSFLATEGGGQ